METPTSRSFVYWTLALIGIVVLIAGIAYQTIMLTKERTAHSALLSQLNSTENSLGSTKNEYERLTALFAELERENVLCKEDAAELLSRYEDEKEKNDDFEDQIQKISGTVGKLDKLSKIDKELLQKYSKVYFLNEHYTPGKVLPIPEEFLTRPDDIPEYVHAQVLPFLEDLLEDATEDGISLLVTSAYRSYDEQRDLKGTYTVQYGAGANTFSADQGYSEHQLGTTVDFTSTEIGGGLTGFQNTKAYAWLTQNAHRYGFVLSYPENNAHYIFEPWHWRFVGEDLADELNDTDKFFYDLEQREIDTYLITIFD